MAKRAKPSSSETEEQDAPEKKKTRTAATKQEGQSSKTTTKRRGIKAAPVATNNKTIDTANNSQTATAAKPSAKVNGGSKGSVTSFLKSVRLTKSQPPGASDTTSKNTNATPVESKPATKENDPPSEDLNTNATRRKASIYLSVFLFAANLVSAAYIVSQNTSHNLAQMRCASSVNKLQLELSNTKDEMKLLRKAIETLEGGYTNNDGMNPVLGSRTIKDHEQFLTKDEIDAWQQSLNALEEDRLSAMNDFNEKLKSLQ